MAGTFEASTINVISPNGLVTKAITASDSGYLTVPSPQFSDAINLTSGQIKFPATQVASSDANTLDDYEEGTWTASLSLGSGSATIGAQTSKYVKIGNTVFIYTYIQISSVSSPSGACYVNGFPFPAEHSVRQNICLYAANSGGLIEGYVNSSSQMYVIVNNGTADAYMADKLKTGSSITINHVYKTTT